MPYVDLVTRCWRARFSWFDAAEAGAAPDADEGTAAERAAYRSSYTPTFTTSISRRRLPMELPLICG